jgi:hypothetical protein
MATKHVFVDFENVQEIDHSLVGGKDVNFTLLIGPTQKKLDSDLVERLLESSATVQLIRLKSAGKNALDFALAYYAGRASVNDPHGHIHIVSKDRGYDPLIDHLTAKGTKAERHASFETLGFTRNPPAAKGAARTEDQVEKAVEQLRKIAPHCPKRKSTLLTLLDSFFMKKLGTKTLEALVAELESKGHIAISPKNVVSYPNF